MHFAVGGVSNLLSDGHLGLVGSAFAIHLNFESFFGSLDCIIERLHSLCNLINNILGDFGCIGGHQICHVRRCWHCRRRCSSRIGGLRFSTPVCRWRSGGDSRHRRCLRQVPGQSLNKIVSIFDRVLCKCGDRGDTRSQQ